jgi:hypothetical protein
MNAEARTDRFWGLDPEELRRLMAIWKHWQPSYVIRCLN